MDEQVLSPYFAFIFFFLYFVKRTHADIFRNEIYRNRHFNERNLNENRLLKLQRFILSKQKYCLYVEKWTDGHSEEGISLWVVFVI
jgi:hypothetical protein